MSYPDSAGCRKFIRTFLFEKTEGRLTVTDRFELAEARSLETAVITNHPVLLLPDCAVIRAGGLDLSVRPAPGTILAGVERLPYHRHDGTPAFVHRIVLKPGVLAENAGLSYTLDLAPPP